MEMTYEQALELVQKSLAERPHMNAVVTSPDFTPTLEKILTLAGVEARHLEAIKDQLLIVLALYAPLSSLGDNIADVTGVPKETAESVATLIESILLDSVMGELTTFDFEWSEEALVPQADSTLKEKLELRPEGVEQMAKPITRDELLNALSAKRTMASDVARVQSTTTSGTEPDPELQ